MDIYTSLLINDDTCHALEAEMYQSENESRMKSIIRKINERLQGFVKWLYKVVVEIISRFQKLFKKTNDTMKNISSKVIITDIYGYVDYLERANDILKDSYTYLEQLRILDQKVNADVSVMDGLKTKIKDSTFRLKAEPSRREYYEQIVYYFQKMDETKDLIDALTIQMNNVSSPVVNPKRYPKDVLEKRIREPLLSILGNLKDLKSKLEVTKKMYTERTRGYKWLHSEDIKRNEKILNLTSNTIKSTVEFESVYMRMITYVETSTKEDEE